MPFEYQTICKPDNFRPFEYQTSPVFRWLLYLNNGLLKVGFWNGSIFRRVGIQILRFKQLVFCVISSCKSIFFNSALSLYCLKILPCHSVSGLPMDLNWLPRLLVITWKRLLRWLRSIQVWFIFYLFHFKGSYIKYMSRISPKRVFDFVEDFLLMVLGCIKSPFISNPCIFQSFPNKEDQRRVKLFYVTDVMDRTCACLKSVLGTGYGSYIRLVLLLKWTVGKS